MACRGVALVVIITVLPCVDSDIYLNNPRGSNNKLSEPKNRRNNNQRLFDSQNNDRGGYQVGDDCVPSCEYNDAGKIQGRGDGARKGQMYYYVESELYIEWHHQHGCGVDHPNLLCQLVLQYMCDADNSQIRDGEDTGTPPVDESKLQTSQYGYHETVEYYRKCQERERNKGLYTADIGMNRKDHAINTRQNAQGKQYGLECPEERDYYPYWHPSPWHDIAVITNEPQRRCEYYQQESQNVKAKGECSKPQFNNEKACRDGDGNWLEREAFDEPKPECLGGVQSRDNHNGNVRNGQPLYYLWKIPKHIIPDGKEEATCVLRIRYNITTGDFKKTATANVDNPKWKPKQVGEDYFHVDAGMNGPNKDIKAGKPVLPKKPKADFLDIGDQYTLQLQVNPEQYGRVFQDRTHTFKVKERPREYRGDRIVNYNVRGRRGNIVQVYPSVEYDFVPTELTVERGTYLHFQWTGSDANEKGNDGNGKGGTDRSNLVQIAERDGNVPLPMQKHTLFFDAKNDPDNVEGHALVRRFAYLDQHRTGDSCLKEFDKENPNNDKSCHLLNAASAYFDGGLVRMDQLGTHHVMSTRNNDFSNRSQKASITIVRRSLTLWETVLVIAALVAAACLISYLAAAWYAFRKPNSWLFSKRYRPRILNYIVQPGRISEKEQERRTLFREERETLKRAAEYEMSVRQPGVQAAAGTTIQTRGGDQAQFERPSKVQRCLSCLGFYGVRLGTHIYLALNVAVFSVGFLSHWGMGFHGHPAYPVAKGAGYTLDLNFAMLVLPTLKSLQTALRGKSGSSELLLMDDPISFHIVVAQLIGIGSLTHIAAHVVHMLTVADAPPMQHDELGQLVLSEEEQLSGAPLVEQAFGPGLVPISGAAIATIMTLIYLTAISCVRRGTNALMRCLGGFKLFSGMHSMWPLLYILLLLHSPARLWIWLFFPVLFVVVDRLILTQHRRPFARLICAELLPFDVLHLKFELPEGFSYQAGQYVLLGWRGEWHPFTLTSAPEEQALTVHIRAPDSLDWCSALRRRLTYEAPVAAGCTKIDYPPKAGTTVRYVKCIDLQTRRVYSRPDPSSNTLSAAPSSQPRKKSHDVVVDVDPDDGGCSFSESDLPGDAVVLQLSGPFGAPAQQVWEYETILVVGSGIGVTPFVSILRSVQQRAAHRSAILGSAGSASGTFARRRAARDTTNSGSGAVKSREELIREVIPVPSRVHFVWVIRDQREVDWFYDLLCEAARGPAKDIIEMSMFLTGEIELSKVRKLDCANKQFFGRPNWGRVFSQLKAEHREDHVGVFLCGSPEIGVQLAKQSQIHSDPAFPKAGMKFSFHKENF